MKEAEKLKYKLGLKNGRRRAGGLGLLSNEDLEIDLLSFSQNHIDVKVKDVLDDKEWRFIGFYGYLEDNKKFLSWKLLSLLKSQSDLPWLCGGDFNEILMDPEKRGGVERRSQMIQTFRDTLYECNFQDLDSLVILTLGRIEGREKTTFRKESTVT